jgi:hypothetical protein
MRPAGPWLCWSTQAEHSRCRETTLGSLCAAIPPRNPRGQWAGLVENALCTNSVQPVTESLPHVKSPSQRVRNAHGSNELRVPSKVGAEKSGLSDSGRTRFRPSQRGDRLTSSPAMASGAAILALELIRVLYDATDRQPAQWRSREGLGVAGSPEAVRYALTRGWLMVQDGDSVCLTDSGRALTQLVILPLSSPVVRRLGDLDGE